MTAASAVATGLFTSAAAGILASLHLAPFGELRRLFFALNAGIALLFLCLALPFQGSPAAAGPTAVLIASAAAAALVIAYVAALYLPRAGSGKPLLGLAAAAALAATGLDGWGAAGRGSRGWLFGANALAAAALLGSVIVAMILGHWYLVRSRLSAGHLVRFARLVAGAIGVRAVLLGAGLLIYGAGSPLGPGGVLRDVAVERGFFFWQRVGFGLIGPAVLAYMIHETARIRSTQSATGILYLAVIFVLIGEFLARYLTVAGAGPI
ncbi:MAG: hypothetical protein ACE5JH_11770 [Acidobacteriota bacterium]